jgi:hypothetical protein
MFVVRLLRRTLAALAPMLQGREVDDSRHLNEIRGSDWRKGRRHRSLEWRAVVAGRQRHDSRSVRRPRGSQRPGVGRR